MIKIYEFSDLAGGVNFTGRDTTLLFPDCYHKLLAALMGLSGVLE